MAHDPRPHPVRSSPYKAERKSALAPPRRERFFIHPDPRCTLALRDPAGVEREAEGAVGAGRRPGAGPARDVEDGSPRARCGKPMRTKSHQRSNDKPYRVHAKHKRDFEIMRPRAARTRLHVDVQCTAPSARARTWVGNISDIKPVLRWRRLKISRGLRQHVAGICSASTWRRVFVRHTELYRIQVSAVLVYAGRLPSEGREPF
jgi:hypothetical protein